MTKYWCVNFDSASGVCLRHGIDRNLWLMQYQYPDDLGRAFQGGRQQAATTRNWRRLKEVAVGDGFVAYLPGNKFYAIGTVISPRRAMTPQDRTNTVDDYVARRRSHDHETGCVYYPPVLYEDFTDEWRHPDDPLMRYAQRIDVDEWRHFVPDGVSVKGLSEIPPHEIQLAVFEIPKDFFDRIEGRLAEAHGSLPKEKAIAVSHDGQAADALSKAAVRVADAGYFSPASLIDEREKKLREIVERRGQPDFRNRLIDAYGGRCAVTGCDAVAALEAAHIIPYSGPLSQHVTNGLLLRADIHTLFDIDLIGIVPELLTVSVSPVIATTVYRELQGRKIDLPANDDEGPNREALRDRWKRFDGDHSGFLDGRLANERE